MINLVVSRTSSPVLEVMSAGNKTTQTQQETALWPTVAIARQPKRDYHIGVTVVSSFLVSFCSPYDVLTMLRALKLRLKLYVRACTFIVPPAVRNQKISRETMTR